LLNLENFQLRREGGPWFPGVGGDWGSQGPRALSNGHDIATAGLRTLKLR
jgi:hypothetical protein